MRDQHLAETFVELADTLVDDFDLIEFLHTLVDRCVTVLDVSAAGIMLVDSAGQPQVMASSTEHVRLLELFQLQSDDGPCLECYRTGFAVSCPDLGEATERWPRFAPAAVEHGYRSVHALPMRLRTQVIGAMNLFHREPGRLAASVTRVGQAMADVATIGLIQERLLVQQDIVIDQLQTALNHRVVIEQAKGILAERHGVDPAEAFALLRRHARAHRRQVTDLALAVISGAVELPQVSG
ncbi:hypothetical protein [Alloactinosynnema sp. L-07]|uniref:GAF and ANTAR domain-containing protein n=1 Tax=Alloactinosynnema sp. L-07 TaxID=1653480 RepID=UPI00065EFBF1|nr:GAF and ANTAR domain-containing protein [Alloactinosynnema sp. L-07]CRK56605.1 hypothetical protein [Alloactinosynnema sp. L-07]